MNNKWNIVIDNSDFRVRTFLHDDGHLCIEAMIGQFGSVYHFIMQDMSQYDKLNDLLKLEFNDVHVEANNFMNYVEDVIDELFDEYLYEYPEDD